jgi:hypothetical protein
VLRYDGTTGAFLDAFATLVDGVSRPRMLRSAATARCG